MYEPKNKYVFTSNLELTRGFYFIYKIEKKINLIKKPNGMFPGKATWVGASSQIFFRDV